MTQKTATSQPESAKKDFACEIQGQTVYLALRRHHVILVIPGMDERNAFVKKVLFGAAEVHIDEHPSGRALFHWEGTRINFGKEEWYAFRKFVQDELA